MNPDRVTITRPSGSGGPGGSAAGAEQFALPSRGGVRTPCRPERERKVRLAAAGEPAIIRLPGRSAVHARNARRRARVLLAAWGLGEQASLGELVVSELVSNAICHGETPIWMHLSIGGGELRVEVHDGGAGRPVRKNAGRGDECGRGLELLDGLIELHGGERGVISDPAGPGKVVYVVMSLETSLVGAR
jgi:hypothetical protein